METEDGKIIVDPGKTVQGYLKQSSWRAHENSNVPYSIGGLVLHMAQTVASAYLLDNVYSEDVKAAHKNADFHLHDLGWCGSYCCGHDFKKLIQEGLSGVANKTECAPARHLNTLMNQAVNYLGILQNENAGAEAFNSFDTLCAPFIKRDGMTDKDVKQCIESFLYGINIPSRWGCQAPFSNITLDLTVPPDLKDVHPVISGEKMSFTYADCQKEIEQFDRQFFLAMLAGDAKGNGFQYPVLTINCHTEFNWDNEISELLFRLTSKYGTPYFSNYGPNTGLSLGDIRSMCLTGDASVAVHTERPWLRITHNDGSVEYREDAQ